MFILPLLLLLLGTMICSNPGVERVFMHAQGTGGLGHGLLRRDGQFHRAFLKCRGIFFRRGLPPRTPLVGCVGSVSPCVRQSIATSMSLGRQTNGYDTPLTHESADAIALGAGVGGLAF